MSRLVLTNAQALNPSGTRFDAGRHIVIADGIIIGVGAGEAPTEQPGEVRLDLAGAYLLPGLIDSHFHLVSRSATVVDQELISLGVLEGTVNAAERLAAGVTSVRDCGCRHRGIYALHRAIESSLLRGPRIYAAGTNPTGPTAPNHWRNVVAHDVTELRAVIRQQVEDGAQWVKLILAHAEDPTDWATVTPYLSAEEIAAAVDEAHQLGVKIGGHCEGRDIAETAVRAGLDSLDHAPLISARVADLMAERGVVYVPTVWAFSSDAGVDLGALSPAARSELLRWQDEHRASVARAHAAGVVIAAGSDAEGSLPERNVLVEEMRALADCGLSRHEVLAAATRDAAALIEHPADLGRVADGALADVVAFAHDPLADLGALEDPLLVIARGQVVHDRLTRSVVIEELPRRARELVVATARWTP
jgi:imidazolonepropionase-like amidohydrolase